MTEAAPVRYRTGALWAVLSVLLLFGTVAAAFVVYGITDLVTAHRLLPGVPAIVGGGGVAAFAFLMITGILYRVDRLRGTPHRRIELFD